MAEAEAPPPVGGYWGHATMGGGWRRGKNVSSLDIFELSEYIRCILSLSRARSSIFSANSFDLLHLSDNVHFRIEEENRTASSSEGAI